MTAQIIISDIVIHQDSEGRYSINDLHKASGGEPRHAPAQYLRLDQVNELIQEILNVQICTFKPITTQRGRTGGTYVCKELVYAYAMWVSAAFSLKVIRAYDAMVSASAPKTTVDERTPLRDAVNLLVSKRTLPYDQAYAIIHQRFAVTSIEELDPETLPVAVEYIHRLALEGELMPAQSSAVAHPVPGSYRLLLTMEGASVISSEVVPDGKMLLHPDEAIELATRAGNVVIHHQVLRQIGSAEIVMACDAAEKNQDYWEKEHARLSKKYGH